MNNYPMRVLHVFASLDRGGAETFIMNLYKSMNRDKVQFDFVKMVEKKCSYEEEIERLGGRIFFCKKPKYSQLFSFRKWWNCFFVQHPEYHIVHVHYFTVFGLFGDVAKKNKVFTICHCHNADNNKVSRYIVSIMSKLAERNADYCFACSKDAGDFFFPNKRYQIIKNAIDIKNFKFDKNIRKLERQRLGVDDNDLVLGHVGRFQKQKNHEFLVKCFAFIHALHPNTKLLLVGDGELVREIKTQIAKENLIHDVIFTGIREDVSNLMSAMDVFLFPSFFEGLGIALIEAQVNGLHCLASKGVPKSADVTGNCRFLELSEKLWGDAFVQMEKQHDEDAWLSVSNAGYDISLSAKMFEAFYRKLQQGEMISIYN